MSFILPHIPLTNNIDRVNWNFGDTSFAKRRKRWDRAESKQLFSPLYLGRSFWIFRPTSFTTPPSPPPTTFARFYMFHTRFGLRVALASRQKTTLRIGSRGYATTLKSEDLQTPTPVAKQLAATKLWDWGRWRKSKNVVRPKGDRARVNITDEALCGMD